MVNFVVCGYNSIKKDSERRGIGDNVYRQLLLGVGLKRGAEKQNGGLKNIWSQE